MRRLSIPAIERLDGLAGTDAFGAILWQIVFEPTPDKVNDISARYRDDASLAVFGVRNGDQITAMIGVRTTDGGSAEITSIVVVRAARGQGVGRALVEYAVSNLGIETLIAETDKDAVGFYRACGFSVQSLGEKYPGVERFCCTWTS